MQLNLQILQEYIFEKYKEQYHEETLGQIDKESEDQIQNNNVGEEVNVNKHGK